MLRAAFCILLSVGLFVPLGRWLLSRTTVSNAEAIAVSQQFILSSHVMPEPGERHAFFAAVVFLPTVMLTSLYLCRRYDQSLRRRFSKSAILGLEIGVDGSIGEL